MDPIFWPYLVAFWANANADGTSTTEVVHHATTADYIVIGAMALVACAIVAWIVRPREY